MGEHGRKRGKSLLKDHCLHESHLFEYSDYEIRVHNSHECLSF